MLQIFGWGLSWLRLIAAPEQIAEVAGRDYWLRNDVCSRYLVRVNVGLGYLGWERGWLRTSMPRLGSQERKCLVAT